LREQMARRPIPVIVVSIAGESGDLVLSALDSGAVDFVQKPTALATERLNEIADELIQKIKSVAQLRPNKVLAPVPAGPVRAPTPRAAVAHPVDALMVGLSTGGPQALRRLIPQLPVDFPIPVAIVLHMPIGYTALFAQRLNDVSRLQVIEAAPGDAMKPGRVLLAPAGRHLSLRRSPRGEVVAHLDAQPFDLPHRPSVDVLFRSAAEVYGERVLGVVMTGMGSDGLQGAAWIKAANGLIFTESESTCIVYGMSRSVEEAGMSDQSVPLDNLAEAILAAV
jgi:two-component system, chemotaxis family, protein-glutamate methylesterase/glutaminase